MIKFIKNIRNKFDFSLRKKLKFTRSGFFIENEPKTGLFNNLNELEKSQAEGREKEYYKKYYLEKLKENSTRRNYLENLYMLDLLEKYFTLNSSEDNIRILDIGSKNWFYAIGQYKFFKYNNHLGRNIHLDGIEIDGYRIYTSFYSRYDAAMYYIKNLKNTRYIVGDLLEHCGVYDYICWFFPFVVEEPLISWGLPLDYFKPEQMLSHAYSLLKSGGKMIIINQGIEEYQIQERLLDDLGIPFSQKGLFESIFLKHEHEKVVTIVEKLH